MLNRLRDIISPVPREKWWEVFNADPEALPYQSPEYFDWICEQGGFEDASRYYLLDDGQEIILPLVKRKGMPARFASAGSYPGTWGIGGILKTGERSAADMQLIVEDLQQLPFASICIQPNPRMGPYWAEAAPKSAIAIPRLAHVIDIRSGFDDIWNHHFAKQTRTMVRRAERNGVTVERDTTGRLMPVFYELYRRSIDRWAEQQNEPLALARFRFRMRDPYAKFEALAKALGEACHVWVASIDGEPAAASIVLQYHNVTDTRNAMNKALAGQTGANDLILKLAIEEACTAGCNFYHLGESGTSVGLDSFKRRFGAVRYPYATYHLDRIPLTTADKNARELVKRLIGFRD